MTYHEGPALQPTRKTQRQRILDLLITARGHEVPAHELAKVSLQYSARVYELRALGFKIENRVETEGGSKHGYFKLVPNALPIQPSLFEKRA